MANTKYTSFENQMNVARTQDGRNVFASGAFLAAILELAQPIMITERFATTYALATNNGMTMQFRRFEALDWEPKELMEGVTPNGQKLEWTDLSVDLHQYGDFLILTDVMLDTNDTNMQKYAAQRIAEQAAGVVEKLRIATLLSGTNVEFANGTARNQVNTPLTLALQRRILRNLRRQLAEPLTEQISSSPKFYTESIAPSYVAFCHPDLMVDISNMEGYVSPINYGTQGDTSREIGSVDGVRYFYTTMLEPWKDAGGAATSASGDVMVSTSGTNADVYPVIFLAKDAYAIVPLKGKDSLTPMVVPAAPSSSDPLGQRSTIGWKTMQASVILNQDWLVRAEVAVSEV